MFNKSQIFKSEGFIVTFFIIPIAVLFVCFVILFAASPLTEPDYARTFGLAQTASMHITESHFLAGGHGYTNNSPNTCNRIRYKGTANDRQVTLEMCVDQPHQPNVGDNVQVIIAPFGDTARLPAEAYTNSNVVFSILTIVLTIIFVYGIFFCLRLLLTIFFIVTGLSPKDMPYQLKYKGYLNSKHPNSPKGRKDSYYQIVGTPTNGHEPSRIWLLTQSTSTGPATAYPLRIKLFSRRPSNLWLVVFGEHHTTIGFTGLYFNTLMRIKGKNKDISSPQPNQPTQPPIES